jgi:hypothetical protein
VQVVLVGVHPHEAGEQVEAVRGIPLAFLEGSPIGDEGSRDFLIVVGERML